MAACAAQFAATFLAGALPPTAQHLEYSTLQIVSAAVSLSRCIRRVFLKLRTSCFDVPSINCFLNVCFIFVCATFAEVHVIVRRVFLIGFTLAVGSRKILTTIVDSFNSKSRAYTLLFGGNIRILQNSII